jgi:hypothetical protein
MSPVALKAETDTRYKNQIYKVPEKAGLSYMIAPVMRTWMLPDWKVHTMSGPRLMFYAPKITNEDIGAVPTAGLCIRSLSKRVSLSKATSSSSSEAEKAKIVTDEKNLLAAVCTYRASLCLSHE